MNKLTLPIEAQPAVLVDRRVTFDRETGVHYSGTKHREDAPSHLLVHDTDICRTRCTREYANPCTRFCPAKVYEMVDDGAGGKQLQINASNCVHCKTCDIMDPYQIIDWYHLKAGTASIRAGCRGKVRRFGGSEVPGFRGSRVLGFRASRYR